MVNPPNLYLAPFGRLSSATAWALYPPNKEGWIQADFGKFIDQNNSQRVLSKHLDILFDTWALRYRGGGGGRTHVTYFAEEGAFFKTSACPRLCKRKVLFCTQVRSMGGENPLIIHETYAALTLSDSASVSAAAKQAENYKIRWRKSSWKTLR